MTTQEQDTPAFPPKPELEFDAIMMPHPGAGTRQPMTMPPEYQATKKLIHEIQEALGIPDDRATEAADWILNKMERYGAHSAQPVFNMEGHGPMCSWCGMIWPLCGHHHMSGNLNDYDPDDDPE